MTTLNYEDERPIWLLYYAAKRLLAEQETKNCCYDDVGYCHMHGFDADCPVDYARRALEMIEARP